MKTVKFLLNNSNVNVEVEDGETLLETLRNRFFLTGVKKGCEVGECGSCTVLINDIPTDSCLVLTALIDGKSILTIEGIAKNGELHPIQQAFIDEGAIQCGYCTPGMVLSSYSLLKKNPNPSTEEIKRSLSGNMCRCGAYVQVCNAVKRAGNIMENTHQE